MLSNSTCAPTEWSGAYFAVAGPEYHEYTPNALLMYPYYIPGEPLTGIIP